MNGSTIRRVLHASTVLVLLLVPVASWAVLRTVLVVVALLAIVMERIRLGRPAVRARLVRLLPVFRQSEANRPSGAMWLAVGYAAASCFPAPAPAAGILVGGLADPAASLGGSLTGGAESKTRLGTLLHVGVGAGVLVILPGPWYAAVAAALVGAAVERWSRWWDDNLVVPPTVSLVYWLLA